MAAPDGEEEVLELSVDVDELLKFASNLEKALKGVNKSRRYVCMYVCICICVCMGMFLAWREGVEGGQ